MQRRLIGITLNSDLTQRNQFTTNLFQDTSFRQRKISFVYIFYVIIFIAKLKIKINKQPTLEQLALVDDKINIFDLAEQDNKNKMEIFLINLTSRPNFKYLKRISQIIQLYVLAFTFVEIFVVPLELAYMFNQFEIYRFLRTLLYLLMLLLTVQNCLMLYSKRYPSFQDLQITLGVILIDVISFLPQLIFKFQVHQDFPNSSVLWYKENSLYWWSGLKILFLLQLWKLEDFYTTSIRKYALSDNWTHFLSLLNLGLMLSFIGHIIGCVFHFVGMIEVLENEANWLQTQGLDENYKNLTFLNNYIASVYYAFMTLTTLGYGEITPVTSKEMETSIFFIMLSSIIFAYIMNSTGETITLMQRNKNEALKKMRTLNLYLRELSVDASVLQRVSEYIKHNDEKGSSLQGFNQLKELNSNIQQLVSNEIVSELISECKLINNVFKFELLEQFCNLMELHFFIYDEMIFEFGKCKHTSYQNILIDYPECQIYFIKTGKIELFYQVQQPMLNQLTKKTPIVLKQLKEGEFFGELSFFSNSSRTCSAKSLEFSYLYLMDRTKAIELLQKDQDQYEYFCMVKDKINLENNYQLINTRCYVCEKWNHIALYCPKIHYMPSKERIKRDYNQQHNQFQKRDEFYERQRAFIWRTFQKRQELDSKLKELKKNKPGLIRKYLQSINNEKKLYKKKTYEQFLLQKKSLSEKDIKKISVFGSIKSNIEENSSIKKGRKQSFINCVISQDDVFEEDNQLKMLSEQVSESDQQSDEQVVFDEEYQKYLLLLYIIQALRSYFQSLAPIF